MLFNECLNNRSSWTEVRQTGWTDRRMDKRTDGRMDGQIPPVFYRTSSPSGPLPKKKAKCDGPTDGTTDGRTDEQTDQQSGR